jgi:hypothetical protein
MVGSVQPLNVLQIRAIDIVEPSILIPDAIDRVTECETNIANYLIAIGSSLKVTSD